MEKSIDEQLKEALEDMRKGYEPKQIIIPLKPLKHTEWKNGTP